ncbi:hypothetical protein ACOBQX_24745 [Actinokineospora sp. G85]|uniref:hypothetical protein n=1 Tax=Actinokineospora sp. G85 TaxID=3406626 RepID=UPI003C71272D
MVGARVDVELATPAKPGDAAVVGCALAPGPWFDAATARPRPRPAHAVWAAADPRGYGGARARGRAHVHLGRGNTALTRPVVLADGFGHGPADHPVAALTGDGPLDALLDSGRDLVLVGFAERHTHVQANAGVLLDVLHRVRREARGPLVVGGVGAGGLVARYALCLFENEGVGHAAAAYLSLDTPHDGAWAPLVLQQLAYYFERFPAGGTTAELLRGPAAQQVFAAWVRDAKYSGPVAAPLRQAFLADLRRVGGFPAAPG